jgi:hypothetical protein
MAARIPGVPADLAGSLVSGLCGALVLSLVPKAATPPVMAGCAG